MSARAGVRSLPTLMVVAFVLVAGQVIAEGTRGALVPQVAGTENLDGAAVTPARPGRSGGRAAGGAQ
ncbi:hypothetical protein ABZS66_34210 [Dactylosporangium sp. NPDC005572]|uniref:hypothetical protein n=1 Tax=Dactylosporangium sp. NPDC005572 TaxID=3156889 RepID=UPI0033A800CB